ncbi:hypothetical protein [Halochromatium glycolicum]|jgi:type I restriction enzyme R subunit|uniref:Uncharacterized protein n=1 Tax=Halochromatium glycolicum TaxID=85075 RepID=A0AAJ0U1W3_9GAMM|nr:hypothetical protein [Halochromatium glycolicum]MBK1703751.1 hypothetical protein [Halochromatium glycolicum]
MQALIAAVVETLQASIGSIDYWHNGDKQECTRSEIKKALMLSDLPELKAKRERIAVGIMKLAKTRHWGLLGGPACEAALEDERA